MKLADKIQVLRKQNNMTQEELAEYLNVSRQAIAKWETDISLPEIKKMIALSELFKVSLDVLLKDELSLDNVKEVHSCSNNAITQDESKIFEGILIKESLSDDRVIDHINVHKTELWNTGGLPKYWTALYFTSDDVCLPEHLSKVMISDPEKGGNWFVDFKNGNTKYIVFRNKILKYQIGNDFEKNFVLDECRKMGISDNEMNWAE